MPGPEPWRGFVDKREGAFPDSPSVDSSDTTLRLLLNIDKNLQEIVDFLNQLQIPAWLLKKK